MPYYITKDTINKSIINIFTNAKLGFEEINLIGDDLINFTFNVVNNEAICNKLLTSSFITNDLYEVCDMLFQLKDYKFYLSYLLQIMLYSKHYNDIAKFMSHMFVGHIGDSYYVSKDFNYEYSERYFDRFIEAIKYSEIDNFKIIPFLFYIYFSSKEEACNKFLRPCKEFLKGVILNNEASFLNFINTEENYRKGYTIYVDLFPEKGAQRLIDNLINENYYSKNDLVDIFLVNKEISLTELYNYITKQSGEKQQVALNFYLSFGQDVKNTLNSLYEIVKDENIKVQLKDEIELGKNLKFDSVKDFIDFVDLESNIPIESGVSIKYLIYFKNGVKVSDKVLSYVFNIFRNVSSAIVVKKYSYFKQFFLDSELNTFGRNLLNSLENKITIENKWKVALICTVCPDVIISELVGLVPTCLGNSELSNFVLSCLVETNNSQVISLIKQLYIESNNKNIYYNYLEILAKNNSISALDYLDEMVSNYGLTENGTKQIVCNGENLIFEITDNLSVKVKNLNTLEYINLSNPKFVDTANAIQLFNDLTKEIRFQIDKFKKAFEIKRYWNPAVFNANILSNPILKKIASTLTWGAYEKENLIKIYSNLYDISNEADLSLKIALVHPVECIENKPMVNFEPFAQINKQVFVANNYNYSANYCNEFNGIAVSEITLNAKLRSLGYKMAVGDDLYYYKLMPEHNLLIKIELNRPNYKNMTVIGNIKFYNLNLVQNINNKFILSGMTPEEIGSVNKRVYSDVLNDVYLACY